VAKAWGEKALVAAFKSASSMGMTIVVTGALALGASCATGAVGM
jgi:hypothetical protein